VIIGAPGYSGSTGRVYIFDGDTLSGSGGSIGGASADAIITGEMAGDRFGSSVSCAGDVSGGWWDLDWSYRKKVTFDNSGQSEDLVNFPTLINLSSSNFDYSKTKPDGGDLRFIDPKENTELKYQLEQWDTSGYSHIWVNVPQIDGGSDEDHIWMYYNNSNTQALQDTGDVWNSNYLSVWHLNESGGGNTDEFKDSTSNGNHGTGGAGIAANTPTQADGKIGLAQDFDGNGDYLEDADGENYINGLGGITVELWIKSNKVPTESGFINGKNPPDGFEGPFTSRYDEVGFESPNPPECIKIAIRASNGEQRIESSSYLQSEVWQYLAFTWSGDNVIQLYVNGSLDAPSYNDAGRNAPIEDLETLIIGKGTKDDGVTETGWNGSIDEVRISNVARSGDWIKAQYLSMNNSFITISSEEDAENSKEDVIVGAPEYGTSRGRAYIFFGNDALPGSADSADVLLYGNADDSKFGHSVSSAGDMNGDNYDDVIVGAYGENRSYIFLGGPGIFTSNLSKAATQHSTLDITSEANTADLQDNDDVYYDVDKDKVMFIDSFDVAGISDAVCGAKLFVQYYTDVGYPSPGTTYIRWALDGQSFSDTHVLVSESTTEVTPQGFNLFDLGVDTLAEIQTLDVEFTNGDTKNPGDTVYFDYMWIEVKTKEGRSVLTPSGTGDFGWSVSSAGDVNGDGLGDVVIGAPNVTGMTPGQAHIKYGALNQNFDNETDETITGEANGDQFGFSVACAGDVDNSGNDDIIVGAPYYDTDDKGRAYVFYGDGTIPSLASNADHINTGVTSGEHFGWSVSFAGDVNVNGYCDILVGSPDYDDTASEPDLIDAGKVYVISLNVVTIPEFTRSFIPLSALMISVFIIMRRSKCHKRPKRRWS